MTPNPKDLVGARKAPLRYVPPALMIEASGPMEDGAIKYGPFNWREYPVEVVTYVEATLRHLFAFLDGQDNAEDSGHSHIGHAIAGLGIIADAKANGTLIDNRYAAGPAAKMLADRDKSDAGKGKPPVVLPACGGGAHDAPCVDHPNAIWPERFPEDRVPELCACHTPGIELGDFHVQWVNGKRGYPPLGRGHVTDEPWGTGDGPVYGMPRAEWDGEAANTGGPKCQCYRRDSGIHQPRCAFATAPYA